ncbi:MAG: M56 family metallopeptidase [Lentisphaeria bacterium]|nr:M56 family metallopeptidase [Lentisphaeria bacterium]
MSWLIVPVTVILFRGAIAVLILAGAESLAGEYLSARVRRALWIMCLFLMMMPQPTFSFQPFAIDLTAFREQVISVADILPREIANLVGDMALARTFKDHILVLTGLSYHNYPYLLGLLLMIVPALFLLLGSYLHCRRRTKTFAPVTDERILNIWQKIRGNSRRTPLLLDSGETPHPPVLFGFFRQKLLLPVKYFQKLDDEKLELILTHEYIHYISGDGIINILTLCFWPFCWYNLFFLAARRRLRINCELACDAEVLKRHPGKTKEYGALLLDFAGTSRPPEVTMAFREYANELRNRIIYMTELPQRRKSSFLVTLGLALVLAAPFGLVSAFSRERGRTVQELPPPPAAVRMKEFPVRCCTLEILSSGKCPLHSHTAPPEKSFPPDFFRKESD